MLQLVILLDKFAGSKDIYPQLESELRSFNEEYATNLKIEKGMWYEAPKSQIFTIVDHSVTEIGQKSLVLKKLNVDLSKKSFFRHKVNLQARDGALREGGVRFPRIQLTKVFFGN